MSTKVHDYAALEARMVTLEALIINGPPPGKLYICRHSTALHLDH
jgi:hypothetical protein